MPPTFCTGCQAERKEEQTVEKEDIHQINSCQAGPLPTFIEDADNEEDKPTTEPPQSSNSESETFSNKPLEEGDRIWATKLLPQAEHIQVTATVSQCLAEGFRQNSQSTGGSKHILPYLHSFSSIFSKDMNFP